MKNRSYIGDAVYVSFDGSSIVLELECGGRPIRLNKDVWHSLVEYIHKQKVLFDPNCQLVEVPTSLFPEVVADLRELEKLAQEKRTKLQ